jgi:predicted dehydrogenase
MTDVIRWGIIATGAIARDFAEGLALAPGAKLVAVGSRAQETADRFGDEYGVPRRYSSYEALAQDPEVDVAYIATPHTLHRDNTLLCLNAGKAVLCEKAFAINARQAEEMVALARRNQLFLMEAMWNRFHPVVREMRRLLDDGAIGEPRLLVADFGLGAPFDPHSRLFDIALGGGALLDLGVYPVALASLVFGSPGRISTQAHLGTTGVDERAGIILSHDDGKLAVLHTSLREKTPSEAMLFGDRGSLKLHGPIFRPSVITLSRPGQEDERIQPTVEGNAYNYEAMEVMRCLKAGETESPSMTLDESLSIMRTMDAIRAAWGLRYPGE